MGGQNSAAATGGHLPRSVEQWPEEAWVAYQERMGIALEDPWLTEADARLVAEEEVRELVRAGRLVVWGDR